MADFDDQPELNGKRLCLRPMQAADRAGLFAAASDPATWEQHPADDRWRPEAFDPYFDVLLDAGGTLVARAGDAIIGCSRFYPVPDHPGDIGIGFTFLAPSHWGGGWNREMKALMLAHAFRHFDRVWFHIAPGNLRSQIATTRLGAVFRYDAELDLGTGSSLTKCYVMTPDSWRDATGQALV
ncbi:MAG: acetyltransferase [Rhodobacteraceae bacterium HLUCCA08]|nr:MAG: acetyltransferase [Rhodobacteraceae bacterium HLUCCA08]